MRYTRPSLRLRLNNGKVIEALGLKEKFRISVSKIIVLMAAVYMRP